MSGSIRAGTAEHRLEGIRADVTVEAEAPDDEVAALIDQAERMCFVLDALQRPHTVDRTITVNGSTRS